MWRNRGQGGRKDFGADQDFLPETCGDSFLQDRFLWGVGAVKKGAFLKLEGSFFIMRAGFCAF